MAFKHDCQLFYAPWRPSNLSDEKCWCCALWAFGLSSRRTTGPSMTVLRCKGLGLVLMMQRCAKCLMGSSSCRLREHYVNAWSLKHVDTPDSITYSWHTHYIFSAHICITYSFHSRICGVVRFHSFPCRRPPHVVPVFLASTRKMFATLVGHAPSRGRLLSSLTLQFWIWCFHLSLWRGAARVLENVCLGLVPGWLVLWLLLVASWQRVFWAKTLQLLVFLCLVWQDEFKKTLLFWWRCIPFSPEPGLTNPVKTATKRGDHDRRLPGKCASARRSLGLLSLRAQDNGREFRKWRNHIVSTWKVIFMGQTAISGWFFRGLRTPSFRKINFERPKKHWCSLGYQADMIMCESFWQ